MLKKILLGLVAIVAVILLIAAFKSPEFRVERSRVIAASADVLFEQVNCRMESVTESGPGRDDRAKRPRVPLGK
jgi:hypothetical protein